MVQLALKSLNWLNCVLQKQNLNQLYCVKFQHKFWNFAKKIPKEKMHI